jgi:hypothetical protein
MKFIIEREDGEMPKINHDYQCEAIISLDNALVIRRFGT